MCRLSPAQLRYVGLLDWQEERYEDNESQLYKGIEGVHAQVCQWSVFDDIAVKQGSTWFRRQFPSYWKPQPGDTGLSEADYQCFVEVTGVVTERMQRAVNKWCHEEWNLLPLRHTQDDMFDNNTPSWW